MARKGQVQGVLYKVWGNALKPYLVGVACEPASVDKVGLRPTDSKGSSYFYKWE